MSNKVFVGSLSWDTTEDGLRAAFEQIGEVSDVHIAIERETGRSRGFGFVTFANEDDAQRAINEMNGASLDGRTLRVDTANERRPRSGGGGGAGGGQRRNNRW